MAGIGPCIYGGASTANSPGLKRLVIVAKVDPAAHTRNESLPLLSVAHYDAATFSIIARNAHGHDVLAAADAVKLVDLHLDGNAVRVPAESALDKVAGLRRVARNNILDRAGEDVAIVRKAGRKGRAVVKGKLLPAAR